MTDPEIRVEPLEGTPGRFAVHVGDLTLPMSTEGDGILRIHDIEWAKMLGFEHPRNIRKLIQRMTNQRKLQGVHVRSTVTTTSMPRGGTRQTEIEEFWLTREQALLVATQSGAPNAWSLTETLVNVFDAPSKVGGGNAIRAVLDAAQQGPRPLTPIPTQRALDPAAMRLEAEILHVAQMKLEANRALWAAEKLERKRAFEAEMKLKK